MADRLSIREPAVRGFPMGSVSHGTGTARIFRESEQTGAFAWLGMGLNALIYDSGAVPDHCEIPCPANDAKGHCTNRKFNFRFVQSERVTCLWVSS